ncbi:MAG: hypothetical protein HY778_08780 [Betaproteobacteria bacterium]|nr:hypothetical protein [Betaproteobacteria bacterium]
MNAPQHVTLDPRVEAAIEYGPSLGIDAPWETNAQGQIIVNPPIGLDHAKRADRIMAAVSQGLPGWRLWPKIGIHTTDGVEEYDGVSFEHGLFFAHMVMFKV